MDHRLLYPYFSPAISIYPLEYLQLRKIDITYSTYKLGKGGCKGVSK